MGNWVSSNYDKINQTFTIGYWKVHSAVHRTTGDRVSLWLMDQEKLAATISNQSERDKYLTGCLSGIQKARKMRHPHILKITDVQEQLAYLGFASEPISTSLATLIGSLNGDDASYICFQLAESLQFLHNNAKLAHLGISPEAILLDENLSVKLFNFDWCTPIRNTKDVDLPFTQYFTEANYPPIKYSAPEIIQCKQTTCLADVFSYALVFYECIAGKSLLNYKEKRDYDIGRNPILSVSGLGSSYFNLFKGCLNIDGSTRPDFTTILETDCFGTLQMKILRYLDLLVTKDPKDKFVFFKNLAKSIEDFSPLMSRSKILPLLISESKADIRFAPVLLGSIFKASEKFTLSEFTEFVFKKILFLTSVSDPPQVLIALLQNLSLILDKTDNKYHADYVYPIMFNALQSNNDILQKECLKKLPLVVEKIAESAVQNHLMPKLVELITQVSEPSIVASAVNCITICLGKSDNETFLRQYLPKVYESWRSHQSSQVAVAMCCMIEKVKASQKTMMNRAIPFAADVTSNAATEAHIQKRLCNWMIGVINGYKTAGKLDEAVEPEIAALEQIATKTPTKFDDFSKNSANSMASFDFGFGSTPAASPAPASPAPSSNQSFDFNKTPTTTNNQPKKNDFNFGNDFGTTTAAKKQDSSFVSPQPKAQTPQNSGFPSPQPKSDFSTFSQARQDFGSFNTPQTSSQNDFAPFGNQSGFGFNQTSQNTFNQPSQNSFSQSPNNGFGQNQQNSFGQNQSQGRPMRNVPANSGFQLSPQGPPKVQQKQGGNNDLLNLF